MLPDIKTLLYATDLSPKSAQVFRYAVALAREHGARIVLLYALEPLGPTATSLVKNVVAAETLKEIETEGIARTRREIHRRLETFSKEELGASASPEELVSEIQIVEGHPAQVILEHAEQVGASMIVMGMQGHTRLEQVLLGSVANKVVQRSAVPVLLVPIPPDD